MGPREWAAIGNLLKISAVAGFLVSVGILDRAYNRTVPADLVMATWAGGVALVVVSIVMWNLKGPLVRGNLILRVLVGLYMLSWIVSTVGFGLIAIVIVYLFTGQPSTYDTTPKGKPAKPRFKAPASWTPTAKVGPSGAMVYTDANRSAASGLMDSYTPVQVVDRQLGAARVVAATGEAGWIDLRTLTEGV